jgi:hypothetical protein
LQPSRFFLAIKTRGITLVNEEVFESMRPDVVIDAARHMSTRKHRLFVCACCRRFWHLIRDPRSQESVRAAELYADKQTTRRNLCGVYNEAVKAEDELIDRRHEFFWPIHAAKYASTWKIRMVTDEVSWSTALIFVPNAVGWYMDGKDSSAALRAEIRMQISLLRDVFANPAPLDLRWRTSTVIGLANTIYDECAFERMPILADALMDAGCDSGEIIAHCRQAGEHVRGCWVVDLLTGRE